MKDKKALVAALERADVSEKLAKSLHHSLVEKWEAAASASVEAFYGCRDYGTHTAQEAEVAAIAAEQARLLVQQASAVWEAARRQWRIAASDLRISEISEEVAA